MNHREVMRQALEALELSTPKARNEDDYAEQGWEEHHAAITALRAALAEPQEPVAWIQPDHLEKARRAPFLCRVEPTQRIADFVPLYTAPQRQPQKPVVNQQMTTEPVAKVELMTTGGNAGLATRIVEIDDHLRERLRPGQMLYLHPDPQRQPLTGEAESELVCRISIELLPQLIAVLRRVQEQ